MHTFMEWLGLLLLFGAAAFILGSRYTRRIDRIEAEKAAERERTDETPRSQ